LCIKHNLLFNNLTMLNTIKLFSSYKWRFSRYNFWIDTFIMQLLLSILMTIFFYVWNKFNLPIIIQISWLIFWIWIIYISFISYIKRLHDLDKSGWMSLLLFVPLANIYLFIICGFFKWTPGKNKYWEDPLEGKSQTSNIPDEL